MKAKFLLFTLFAVCFSSLITVSARAQMFAHWLDVPINKGIIKGDFTITFETGAVIKPNEPFDLTTLGIKATEHADFSPAYFKDSGLKSYKKEFRLLNKSEAYCFYHIKITRENDPTTYYGMVCFYGTTSSHKNDAVCKSYELKISNALFDNCKGGNLSNTYEFWSHGGTEIPTWIILLSDSEELFKVK